MKGLDRILNYFIDFSQQRVRLHTLMKILKITVTGAVSCLYTFSITDSVLLHGQGCGLISTSCLLMSVLNCWKLIAAQKYSDFIMHS